MLLLLSFSKSNNKYSWYNQMKFVYKICINVRKVFDCFKYIEGQNKNLMVFFFLSFSWIIVLNNPSIIKRIVKKHTKLLRIWFSTKFSRMLLSFSKGYIKYSWYDSIRFVDKNIHQIKIVLCLFSHILSRQKYKFWILLALKIHKPTRTHEEDKALKKTLKKRCIWENFYHILIPSSWPL